MQGAILLVRTKILYGCNLDLYGILKIHDVAYQVHENFSDKQNTHTHTRKHVFGPAGCVRGSLGALRPTICSNGGRDLRAEAEHPAERSGAQPRKPGATTRHPPTPPYTHAESDYIRCSHTS